jgi:choline dehydrogenase
LLPHEAAFGGRVRLRSCDPRQLPLVERGFLTQAADTTVIVEALELARTLADAEPLRGFLARELQPGGRDLRDYVPETVRNYFQPAGTCAIGDVTDGRGRGLGIDGLVIADASLMPTIPRSNTNLTTLAIADRIARLTISRFVVQAYLCQSTYASGLAQLRIT